MARRVALIVNARARGLGGGERRALSRGAAAGVTVVETTSLDHARAEIRRLVATGLDVLGLAGGDGTVVMGLTLLAEACRGAGVAEPAVAVVPLGTGNAFARALRDLDPGLARALPARLAQLIDPARTPVAVRTLSVLGVRTPFCGFGIDAQLLEDQRDVSAAIDRIPLVRGVLGPRARYAASVALRSAPLWMLSDRPEVTLRNLGTPAREVRGADAALVREVPAGAVMWSGPCTLAACATIPYFGFGLRMFTFASSVGDRFQVRASDAGVLEILRHAPAAFRGRYFTDQTHDFLADRIEIELSAPVAFEAGGELLGHHQRVEVALAAPIRML